MQILVFKNSKSCESQGKKNSYANVSIVILLYGDVPAKVATDLPEYNERVRSRWEHFQSLEHTVRLAIEE